MRSEALASWPGLVEWSPLLPAVAACMRIKCLIQHQQGYYEQLCSCQEDMMTSAAP